MSHRREHFRYVEGDGQLDCLVSGSTKGCRKQLDRTELEDFIDIYDKLNSSSTTNCDEVYDWFAAVHFESHEERQTHVLLCMWTLRDPMKVNNIHIAYSSSLKHMETLLGLWKLLYRMSFSRAAKGPLRPFQVCHC